MAWFELGARAGGRAPNSARRRRCRRVTVRTVSAGLPDLSPAAVRPGGLVGHAAQRLGSQVFWSRTMAKAILLARCAMAVMMIPPGLPRARSSAP